MLNILKIIQNFSIKPATADVRIIQNNHRTAAIHNL